MKVMRRWRKRMGIEPTTRYSRATGFEDQGSHQTSIASVLVVDRKHRFLRLPCLLRYVVAIGAESPLITRCSACDSTVTNSLREFDAVEVLGERDAVLA